VNTTRIDSAFAAAAWLSAFKIWDASTWEWYQYCVWAGVIMLGFEILQFLVFNVPPVFVGANRIPIRGKHLDEFSSKDLAFISWNKLTATIFVYHSVRYCWLSSRILWATDEVSLLSTLGAFVTLFVVYDLFYSVFHRILHLRSIYKYIHKHHHQQHAPSRGSNDAVNVHPVEYILGEYNHLLAIFLVSQCIPVHVQACAAFIAIGGVMSSLNHTRYDIVIPGVFDTKAHDHHHVIPTANYGQYHMLWDWCMGTYQPHPSYRMESEKEAKE